MSHDTTVRALSIDATEIRQLDGLYSLNDLHKAAGGEGKFQPSNFLRLETTRSLMDEISSSSDLRIIPTKTVRGRGKLQGTYVCRELVYAYAMWVSPRFHLHVIRAFDALARAPITGPAAPQQRALVTIEGGRITSLKDLSDCSVVHADGLRVIRANLAVLAEQLRWLEGEASGDVLERKLRPLPMP